LRASRAWKTIVHAWNQSSAALATLIQTKEVVFA
jgi:hypothetical protein